MSLVKPVKPCRNPTLVQSQIRNAPHNMAKSAEQKMTRRLTMYHMNSRLQYKNRSATCSLNKRAKLCKCRRKSVGMNLERSAWTNQDRHEIRFQRKCAGMNLARCRETFLRWYEMMFQRKSAGTVLGRSAVMFQGKSAQKFLKNTQIASLFKNVPWFQYRNVIPLLISSTVLYSIL